LQRAAKVVCKQIIEVYENYDKILQKELNFSCFYGKKHEKLSEYDEDYISYENDINAWISYVETVSSELSFSVNDIYSEVDAVMQIFVDNNKDGLFKKDDNELPF
jgi:hypothetical protein